MHQLSHLMRSQQFFVGLLLMLYAGAVLAVDDCTLKNALSIVVPDLDRGCPKEDMNAELTGPKPCIKLERVDSGLVKIGISKPGHYCLTEDLHARLEFADHPAEGVMIVIQVSDVILDLQGHTLGRGRLFKNPGGAGIVITDQTRGPRKIADSKNIVIRNGVLQDFRTAVAYHGTRSYNSTPEPPVFDQKTNTYRFPQSEIVLENLTFKNNKQDFDIRFPDNNTP